MTKPFFFYFNPRANTSVLETIKNSNIQPLHPSQTASTITKMFLQKRKPSLFNENSTYSKGITREENTVSSSSCSIWRVHLLPVRKSVDQKYELKTSIPSLNFLWPGGFTRYSPHQKSQQSKWNINFTKREQKLIWFHHIHVTACFEDSY